MKLLWFSLIYFTLTGTAAPPSWPNGISIASTGFVNWAKTIRVPCLWTATPKSENEVVEIVNWAFQNGYKVRPSGIRGSWSPITVSQNELTNRIILLDTTSMTNMKFSAKQPDYATIKTQSGALLGDVMALAETEGYGFTCAPVTGQLTIGGIMATNTYGTGIPKKGETASIGKVYGSISNLVSSFKAVSWDPSQFRYIIKSFNRSDSQAPAFLTNLGATVITEVTLMVGKNENLRAISLTNVPVSELYADPNQVTNTTRTITRYVDEGYRISSILYPFTKYPWIRLSIVADQQPAGSRTVTQPYNYPFADDVPETLADILAFLTKTNIMPASIFGPFSLAITRIGLLATRSYDIWGKSKNILQSTKLSTVKIGDTGGAILTERSNIQRVVHEFYSQYQALLMAYEARGMYPMNNPIEFRITGLDHPQDVFAEKTQYPFISAIGPVEDYPQFNVAVLFEIVTFPGTPHAHQFLQEMESFLIETYQPPYALFRPAWSKGFGYTPTSAWSNSTVFNYARSTYKKWDETISIYKSNDPNGVFRCELEDRLFYN